MPCILTEEDYISILSAYDSGEYQGYARFSHGAGQTTLLLKTTKANYVLRYYKNRTTSHVQYEVRVLEFLRQKHYPVPAVLPSLSGERSGIYKGKPFMILDYIPGHHCQNPNTHFEAPIAKKVVEAVARLHTLTQDKTFGERQTFDSEYCWRAYNQRLRDIDSVARAVWFKQQLDTLEFPENLPRGLCHSDLNHSNFVFHNNALVAVLDFDMSFETFLIYDLASLIYWWAWIPGQGLQHERTAFLVQCYTHMRRVSELEKAHIFDALKLIMLLGISWSVQEEFEESFQGVEELNHLGREGFYRLLSHSRRSGLR